METAPPPAQTPAWPEGWYSDPWAGDGTLRWWDGTQWSGHVHAPAPAPAPEPAPAPAPAPAASPRPDPAPTPATSTPPPVAISDRPSGLQPLLKNPNDPRFSPDLLLPEFTPVRKKTRRDNTTITITLMALALSVIVLLGSAFAIRKIAPGGDGNGSPAGASQNLSAGDADAIANARTAQVAMETFATDHGGGYRDATPAGLTAIEPTLGTTGLTVLPSADGYDISVTSATGNIFKVNNVSGFLTFPCSTAGTGGCPSTGFWGGNSAVG